MALKPQCEHGTDADTPCWRCSYATWQNCRACQLLAETGPGRPGCLEHHCPDCDTDTWWPVEQHSRVCRGEPWPLPVK